MNYAGPQETLHQFPEAVMLDAGLETWHERVDDLIAQGARIIAFRGAGTVNGIDPEAATTATTVLSDYVRHLTAENTPVVLLYDGDGDVREKPDIGSIFGSLVDELYDDPYVTPIAAQTRGWYNPRTENGAIESATGKPYETFVFPDNLPGAHATLTQSEKLIAYPGYEQIFVGPAGPIGLSQLQDLDMKARSAEIEAVKVTVLTTPNNAAIDEELHAQLEMTGDEQARTKIIAKLTQRAEQPYGAFFTREGHAAIDYADYPGISLTATPIRRYI